MVLRVILIVAVLLLTAADHWTTYLCLRAPVSGWLVTEANPVADWLFQQVGLIPGLIVDSLLTVAALATLVITRQFTQRLKTAVLAVVAVATSYAVVNNLFALSSLGLLPFGSA